MALCTSCGAEVAGSVKFCTACGKPMEQTVLVSAQSSSRLVCPACGASADPASTFCTICGKALQPSETATAAGNPSLIPSLDSLRANAPPGTYCTACGAKLNDRFCTFCGHPADTPEAATAAAPAASLTQALPASAVPVTPASSASTTPAGASVPPPISTSVAPAPEPEPMQSSRPAAQAYSESSRYIPSEQPSGGGSFGKLVLVLFFLIILGVAGAWYFSGVETIVVCSPPNVRVFLDDNEIAPASFGRYVIPHLSRKPHLLKIQSPGFADTIQRLDFPLTSSREWVNIRLVPSRR